MRKSMVTHLLVFFVLIALIIPASAVEVEPLDSTITWFALGEKEEVWGYNREMGWLVINTGENIELSDNSYIIITRIIDRITGMPVDGYDYVEGFSEELAAVGKLDSGNRKWGYINEAGETVIPLQYASASSFSEGLAVVGIGDWGSVEYGYINTSGDMVIQPEYDEASEFSDGIAKVARKNAHGNLKWGLIDKTGRIIAPLEYDRIDYYSSNYEDKINNRIYGKDTTDASKRPILVAKTNLDGELKLGYIDRKGNVLIPLIYDEASPFVDGLALVGMKDDSWEKKWGFINVRGDVAVPLEYDNPSQVTSVFYLYGFLQDLFPVSKKDSEGSYKYGFVDKKGNLSIPLQYDSVGFFTEDGLAPVTIVEGDNYYSNRRAGYIDQTGKVVIPLEYVFAESFRDGVAAVAKLDDDENVLWGAIDKTGTTLIPFKYDSINIITNSSPLEDVLVATKYDESGKSRYELFNMAGNAILPTEYEATNIYSSAFYYGLYGLIPARKDGEEGERLLDMEGNAVLSYEYDDIDIWGSIIIVQRDGQFGVLDNPYWEEPDESILESGSLPMALIIIGIGIAIFLVAVVVVIGNKKRRKTSAGLIPEVPVQATSPTDSHSNSNAPKFCPHCGSPLSPGFKFCSECGNSILEIG